LREEEPLREEETRKPEEEERRAEEEERDRMDEETSTLFAKLRLSLIDPAFLVGLLTITAAITSLALAYQTKRAKFDREKTRLEETEEAIEKAQEERGCTKSPGTIAYIIIAVVAIILSIYLIS
jgi:hypothetical protein